MTRYTMAVGVVVLGAAILMATPVQAQPHLQVSGGMTRAAGDQPFFGAAIGLRLGAVDVGVEGGRFHDILSPGAFDALNDLQRDLGLPLQAIAAVPATYALASVRIIPGIGPIRPFVSGGVGAARLTPRFNIVVEGIPLGDVFGLTSFEARTGPMAAIGAGVRVDGGRVHVEGGYRYLMIFDDYRSLNVSPTGAHTGVGNVYAAIGVRF